jgi:FkbM family methyltransferase
MRVQGELEESRTRAEEAERLGRELVRVQGELEESRTRAEEAERLGRELVRVQGELEESQTAIEKLSAVLRHEVPHLGSSHQTPIACDARDVAGLLRIAEAQASDLVRLRRALLSAQAVAAQRLQFIHADAKVLEWVRSTVLGEITRIQGAVSDVVERSRWRQIGQRLGLAKRLAWETGHWQTDLTATAAEANPSANSRPQGPSMAELLVELERMHWLLDHLRLSRWRKLGHWLGLAKRLPWESGAWRDPLLIKPFPGEAGSRPSAELKAGSSPSSYEGFIEYAIERFLAECRSFATDAIFDIGANTGQFALGLRASGYHGHMISFEPLSDAHTSLTAAAASDPLWDVAERCAVGASDSWASINIAGNSASSSLLPMLDLHREAAPQSAYQGTETCRVITLDSYIERTFSEPTTLFGLKIDTQGYEAQVLAGLKRNHERIKVILCEMSIAPLYAHGPSMSELCHILADLGYRCIALGPEFEHPGTGELLQANGVFVKRG